MLVEVDTWPAKLLDYALKGVCVVTGSNTVCYGYSLDVAPILLLP